MQLSDKVLDVTEKVIRKITAAQLMLCFGQISSRVLQKNERVQRVRFSSCNSVVQVLNWDCSPRGWWTLTLRSHSTLSSYWSPRSCAALRSSHIKLSGSLLLSRNTSLMPDRDCINLLRSKSSAILLWDIHNHLFPHHPILISEVLKSFRLDLNC